MEQSGKPPQAVQQLIGSIQEKVTQLQMRDGDTSWDEVYALLQTTKKLPEMQEYVARQLYWHMVPDERVLVARYLPKKDTQKEKQAA